VAVAERIKSADDVRQRTEGCKDKLTAMMEPNFGLVEELLGCRALSSDEREEVRAAKTKSKRSRKLLKYILKKSDDTVCCRLLHALDKTDQHHVVNYILQDSGSPCPLL